MRHLFLLGLVAVSTQATAQLVPRDSAPQATLTIDQAIELARRNNPVLQQTLNNRIGARAAVRSAYGALLPSADASLSAQRQQGGQQIFSGTSLGASSDVNQSNYQIGFNYRLNSATLITPSLQRANRNAVEADITGARGGTSSREMSKMPVRRRNAVDPLALRSGDHVVHEQHGIGRYLGLTTLDLGDGANEFLHLLYANDAKLYVPVSSLHLISRYSGASPEAAPEPAADVPSGNAMDREMWSRAAEREDQNIRRNDAAATGNANASDPRYGEHYLDGREAGRAGASGGHTHHGRRQAQERDHAA